MSKFLNKLGWLSVAIAMVFAVPTGAQAEDIFLLACKDNGPAACTHQAPYCPSGTSCNKVGNQQHCNCNAP